VAGCKEHLVLATTAMHSNEGSLGILTLHVKMFKSSLHSLVAATWMICKRRSNCCVSMMLTLIGILILQTLPYGFVMLSSNMVLNPNCYCSIIEL